MVDINRINELAKKSKEIGLTEDEKAEQAMLRSAYIDGFKKSLESQLKNTYLVDEDGTKTKLKKKEDN